MKNQQIFVVFLVVAIQQFYVYSATGKSGNNVVGFLFIVIFVVATLDVADANE